MEGRMVRPRKVVQADIGRKLVERSGLPLKRVSLRPDLLKASLFSRYLNVNETSILVDLVRSVAPKVMIEFGCNIGITAKRVLDGVPSLERYIGVDVDEDHVPTLPCQLDEVPKRAGAYVADDPRFFLLSRPTIDLRSDSLEPCDAVFIDGDHSETVVLYESKLARELIRLGGIVVWHDYGNPAVEVTSALDQLHFNGWPIVSVENSWLAFMRIV
jgi:Methyltransferase domain